MNPNFKISNIRATNQFRDLTEENHVSMFILHSSTSDKDIKNYRHKITKTIARIGKKAFILFDIQNKTWWCDEQEFNIIKFALENTTGQIILFYIGGFSYTSDISGTDGYELIIRFE